MAQRPPRAGGLSSGGSGGAFGPLRHLAGQYLEKSEQMGRRIRFAVDQLRHSLGCHMQELQPSLGVGVPHLALLVRLLRTAQILRRDAAVRPPDLA